MEPVSAHAPNSDGDEDKKCLMALSVTELISILRTAYRTVDYDRVEEVLVDKETKLKAEIGVLGEKLEMENLERMNVEEQLKKYKEQSEKGKKAEERYEKLLQAVKKNNDLGDGNTITELRNKNRKLEDEKRRAESEMESWKRKCEELNERLLMVEKGAKSSMKGYTRVEIRRNAEDLSGVRRNTDQGVSTEAIDKMEMNEFVIRSHESGNTAEDSSPSQRKTEFVNLASDDADSDAENAQLETKVTQSDTEGGHDDRSMQQQYNAHYQHQGSHIERQVPSHGPCEDWKNYVWKKFVMDQKAEEVAKINKRNRGKKQTIHHTSGLKTQASKKAKMDARHQRKINGNKICIEVNKHKDGITSPTVQTKIDTIVEKQSQEGSSDEMVIDERGDVSTQALGNPEPSSPTLTQMLDDYISHYSTPYKKGTSLGQQLEELKALNSMFTQVIMKNQSSCIRL